MKKIATIIALVLLTLISFQVKSQDTFNNKRLTYTLTSGFGFSSGPTDDNPNGIGYMFMFQIEQNKNAYAIGFRHIEDLEILGSSDLTIANNNFEITYGRLITQRKVKTIISSGLGYMQGIREGKYLYGGGDPWGDLPGGSGGGWFNSGHYEKIKVYSLLLPLSLKFIFNTKKDCWKSMCFEGGVAVEIFALINSKKSAGGVNFCFQLGWYKKKK